MNNYIKATWTDSKCTLITHVEGKDLSYIEYDKWQLDALIALLQKASSAMKDPH